MRDIIIKYLKEAIVDKVLYHGSYTSDMTVLKPYSNRARTIPPSIFLSSSRNVVEDYGSNIYECNINVNNIKEIDVHGNSFHNYVSFERDIYSAYDDGHDCVIFKNIMDSKEPNTEVPISDIYVLFESEKIKILDI